MGPVDVLVCNAGASVPGEMKRQRKRVQHHLHYSIHPHHPSISPFPGRFLEQDPSTSRSTMDLNYFGVESAIRGVLPGMVARRQGKVVVIASAMAVCGERKWSERERKREKMERKGAQGLALTRMRP